MSETQEPLKDEARTYTHESSPVKSSKHYAEHNRDDESKSSDFETGATLLKFLRQGEKGITAPRRPKDFKFSKKGFAQAASSIAASVKERHFNESPLLVFKETGDDAPLGHCVRTSCKPDIIAAWKGHFDGEKPPLWPLIRLVGEDASKGMSRKYQDGQAKSYLHYLLLARPDLYVAQGILVNTTQITLQVGIGGHGIRSLVVNWTDKALFRLLYVFIYRLYSPGQFADPTYTRVDTLRDSVIYTVTIMQDIKVAGVPNGEKKQVVCPNFAPIFASNPFGTRTHVLFNPDSEVSLSGSSKKLRVLKEQLCRIGTRFDENAIIEHIHESGIVPGFVQALHHEENKLPLSNIVSSAGRRLGMCQYGTAFDTIGTALEMLYTVYDLLEVLRHLRVHRKVLHRDISKGNVLYVLLNDNEDEDEDAGNIDTGPVELSVSLVFIRGLLGKRNKPQDTSTLLIDLNRGEDLESKTDEKRMDRTGTPLFIARAVQRGSPVPSLYPRLPQIPPSPEVYTSRHPNRVERFPQMKSEHLPESATSDPKTVTRHELNHDVESVFWPVFYWAMRAQPQGKGLEPIDAAGWNLLATEEVANRENLLESLCRPNMPKGIFHSTFGSLWALTQDLADIIRVDRHWYPDKDPRNNPEFFAEAFQRLILQFILDNSTEDFMKISIDPKPRKPAKDIPACQYIQSARTRTPEEPAHDDEEAEEDEEDEEDEEAEDGEDGELAHGAEQADDDEQVDDEQTDDHRRKRPRYKAG
ncbi:hypothetical protein FRB90_006014 [Tulasnella sp. 427]|nr:hypothetical protein FRB90_006014 [Tulasnella sp. 427]